MRRHTTDNEFTQRHGWRITENKTWTLFLQDSWMVSSKLTLNLGVRFESIVEETPTGFRGLDWGFGDRIQPRLGFAYALGTQGDSNLHGFYGRYHDTFSNAVTLAFVETPNLQYNFAYWNPELGDWGTRTYFDIGAANTSLATLDLALHGRVHPRL